MTTPNTNVRIPVELKEKIKKKFPYSSFTQIVIRALDELSKREEVGKST